MDYAERPDVIVLGLPRGGVPVAYEVAKALEVPLDVFIVRKLGVPGREELAMGAIATGGVRMVNKNVVSRLGITSQALESVAAPEQKELERRELLYRSGPTVCDLRGRTVIVVDDGLATGSTMRAAAAALRKLQVKRIVVCVPVAAPDTCDEIKAEVDEIVCAATPEPFLGVGRWYHDFSQTTDGEVLQLVARARHHQSNVSSYTKAIA